MRQETMMVVFNEAPASAKQAGVLHPQLSHQCWTLAGARTSLSFKSLSGCSKSFSPRRSDAAPDWVHGIHMG